MASRKVSDFTEDTTLPTDAQVPFISPGAVDRNRRISKANLTSDLTASQVHVGPTPPTTNLVRGREWLRTPDGIEFRYVDTGTNQFQWVQTGAVGGLMSTAASVSYAGSSGLSATTVEAALDELAAVTGAGSLEGVTLTAYGNSWVAGTSHAHPWVSRIASRLPLAAVRNRGYGGSTSYNIVAAVNSGANSTIWTPGDRGIVVIGGALNDARLHNTDARSIATYKRSITTACRILRSAARYEQGAATLVGPWVYPALALGGWYSGDVGVANTAGHYAEFTFTGTEVTLIVGRERVGGNGGTSVVKEGATVLATFDHGGGTDGPGADYEVSVAQDSIHLSGLAAGSHTIRLEHTGGTNVWFDGWATPSATPPTIVLLIDPGLVDYSGYAPYNVGSDVAIDAYAAAAAEVAAAFPTGEVVVCDPRPGWSAATMICDDDVHPNDRGAGHLAAALASTLAALPFRRGQNLLTTTV